MSVTETFGNADVPESAVESPAPEAAEPAPEPAAPENLIAESRVEHIEIAKIDFTDESFRFRASLRLGPLKKSIQAEGQQLPIIVRKVGKTKAMRYQIISGFRRATAMKELGLKTIAAIVREDLASDEAAFKASVIENEQRKTYSAIDRATVLLAQKKAGFTSIQAADLMGLSKRQANNLLSLLDLPQVVQEAIDDPAVSFEATHGLVLGQLLRRYPDLDAAVWVEKVKSEGFSVAQLKRAVNKENKVQGRPALGSIFNQSKTDAGAGVYRLSPVRVVVADLGDGEKESLRAELKKLLKALG